MKIGFWSAALLLASWSRREAGDAAKRQPQVQTPPSAVMLERTTVTERVYLPDDQAGRLLGWKAERPAVYIKSAAQLSAPLAPLPSLDRRWEVVGEKDGWLDEW